MHIILAVLAVVVGIETAVYSLRDHLKLLFRFGHWPNEAEVAYFIEDRARAREQIVADGEAILAVRRTLTKGGVGFAATALLAAGLLVRPENEAASGAGTRPSAARVPAGPVLIERSAALSLGAQTVDRVAAPTTPATSSLEGRAAPVDVAVDPPPTPAPAPPAEPVAAPAPAAPAEPLAAPAPTPPLVGAPAPVAAPTSPTQAPEASVTDAPAPVTETQQPTATMSVPEEPQAEEPPSDDPPPAGEEPVSVVTVDEEVAGQPVEGSVEQTEGAIAVEGTVGPVSGGVEVPLGG